MTKEELNEKLVKWRWPDASIVTTPRGTFGVVFDGETTMPIYPELFTDSLDACFKYLVPKLWGMPDFLLLDYQFNAYTRNLELLRHSWFLVFEDDKKSADGLAESPSMALCLAFNKLIEEEKK